MAFHDFSFLFVLFPLVLLAHRLMPVKGRNVILLLFSLLIFAWGEPRYVILMLLSIVFNYFSGLEIAAYKAKEKPEKAKFALISAVIVNLALLGFFKYSGFLAENLNALLGLNLAVPKMSMPIGISFFTFSILSYLFDVYRDKAPAAKNVLDFSLFVTFFPKLVSGPIVQYSKMEEQIRERTIKPAMFGQGCRLFLIGLAKKMLLSNTIGTTFYALTAMEEVSVVSAWLGAISYALMLYYDFSGYSDMAIGIARMFGFVFDKNFDYPYISSSITEFWRRWHISLGAWFRDYVYIPLGGSREGQGKTIRNLCIVWLLTGIWHGASWNFLVWGAYYGILLILEKFVLKSVLEKLPNAVKRAFTLVLVLIGWVFFFSADLGSAISWLGQMFGIGAAGVMDTAAKYYLASSWLVLLIGILGATPLCANLGSNVYRGGKVPVALSVVWFGGLLVLCIAGMMTGTYSTFLYVQF